MLSIGQRAGRRDSLSKGAIATTFAYKPTRYGESPTARVGTTRSRINSFMNKFRKLGLIEYNGELKVHTSLLNVIVHE